MSKFEIIFNRDLKKHFIKEIMKNKKCLYYELNDLGIPLIDYFNINRTYNAYAIDWNAVEIKSDDSYYSDKSFMFMNKEYYLNSNMFNDKIFMKSKIIIANDLFTNIVIIPNDNVLTYLYNCSKDDVNICLASCYLSIYLSNPLKIQSYNYKIIDKINDKNKDKIVDNSINNTILNEFNNLRNFNENFIDMYVNHIINLT